MNDIKSNTAEQLQQLQMLMHRASSGCFRKGGRMHNPLRGQGRVLAILKLKPEISQKELTYLLGMSKQALAELLAKLEKGGYITRHTSEEDKRVTIIRLTEAGMNSAEEDCGSIETLQILDCLNDEELADFSGYLSRIIRRYEEQFPNEDFEERRRNMECFMEHHRHGCGHHGRNANRGFDCHEDYDNGHYSGPRGRRRHCENRHGEV